MKATKSFQHDGVSAFGFGFSPIGKPRLFAYCFYVDGLLIDTGQSRMRGEVMDATARLPIDQILITHHHEDHNGNLKALQARNQVPAYASPLCAELLKDPPKISFAQFLVWGKTEANFDIIPIEGSIETPNHKFELILSPGHAADMYCLYERNKGWLFSADLWVKQYIRYFMRQESMAEQIDSIRNILKVDFDTLFCNHNPQMTGGKDLMQQKLQFLEDFYGKAAGLYSKGLGAKQIFKEMKLKEDRFTKFLSGGALSGINMIRSVIRDEEQKRQSS